MALSISLGGGRRHWEVDVSVPPVEKVQKGSLFFGLFMTVFALVWGGVPVLGLIEMLQQDDVGPEVFMVLLFPMIGTGILLYGIHSLLWRRVVAFDGQSFTVSEGGLKGGTEWREPLAAYLGVLSRTRRVRTKNSSYTVYMVDLVHDDADRTINLYSSTDRSGFREKWEHYARTLGVPALEEGAGGMVRREAEDLDKSVGELLAEGKVEVDRDALSRPAEGIAVRQEGDVTVITRTGPAHRWWGALLGILFPLVFIGVAAFAPDMPFFGRLMFGGMGALFEVIFVIGVITDRLSRQRLRVGPAGVWVNRAWARSESKGKRIPADEIETVKLAGGESGSSQYAVSVSSDTKTLMYGAGLPRATLEFVLNTVLAKLGEARRYRRR